MSVFDDLLDFPGGGELSFDLFDSFDLFLGTLNSEACEPSSEVLSLTAMVNGEARSDEL